MSLLSAAQLRQAEGDALPLALDLDQVMLGAGPLQPGPQHVDERPLGQKLAVQKGARRRVVRKADDRVRPTAHASKPRQRARQAPRAGDQAEGACQHHRANHGHLDPPADSSQSVLHLITPAAPAPDGAAWHGGLVIDNFAGGGGASTGIEAAFAAMFRNGDIDRARVIDIAINHDPEAVAMHAANHPATLHYCQSVWQADPSEVTAGRPVALAWFSPDCKHFSKAKGGKPVEKGIRDLAWVVVQWAQRVRPAVIMLENVEEFRTWGPLTPEGKPDKARAGETFAKWTGQLRKAGYRIQWRELRACDYGAPTSRKRFFMIARCDGLPLVWPEPTHGKPGTPEVLTGKRLPWRTAAEIIDWSRPCPSIFDRERPLKEATLRRIAHGVMRYVVNAAEPFIVRAAHGDDGRHRTHPIGEPLGAQPASNEFAVASGSVFPITHTGDDTRGQSASEPLRTITTAKRGEQALAGATLIQCGYGEREGQSPRALDPEAPLGTVVAGGVKHGVAVAHLEKFSENSRGKSPADPLDTVMAGAPRHGVVSSFLSHFYTSNTNGGQGDPRHPAKTITAAGGHHAIVAAHMEQANTGMVGHAATTPVSTIVGRGTTQRLIETTLVEADALPPELLERAVTVAAFLIKYYGNEQDGHRLGAPIGTVTTKDRFAVITVTIDAATYILVDIGMRMLTPRELARAQGFPDSYILDPIVGAKPLTKTAQTRMIGNSVCPPLAEALVRANFPAAEAERAAA